MMIYLEDERGFFEAHKGLYEKVEKVIQKCVEKESVPYKAEVSLSIVDLHEIREINRDYREIDAPTDVLSFPQIEMKEVGKIDWDTVELADCMNLDTQRVMLGDIVLCEEKAKEQAESYGHSLEREVCFLVAHSMFHLLGYDHMTDEDEKIMFDKQEEVLKELDIVR